MTRWLLAALCLACLSGAAGHAAETTTVERPHAAWEQRKFTAAVALRPTLHLPDGQAPFPLVIVVNSSAGARDFFLTQWPEALVAAGIAAVSLDTFTPRGIRNTTRDQSQISAFTMALDALATARHYAADPRIDPGRIVVSGHSKGASAAVHLANAEFYARYGASPAFTAGMAFSPDCFLQFDNTDTVFPLHALSGEKDDVTPPAYCIPLFARLNGNPHPATLEIIPATWHSWSIDGPAVRFQADLPNISRGPCAGDAPFMMEPGLRFRSSRTGDVISLDTLRTRCAGGTGKTFGGGRENLPLAFGKAIAWLRAVDFGTGAATSQR